MKRALSIVLILTLSLVLVACGASKTPLEMLNERISYSDIGILVGDTDDYHIELSEISGEVAPRIDGKVGEGKHRYILTLKAKKIDDKESNFTVDLADKENKTTLTLQKDILGLSYSAHIEENILTFRPTKADVKKGDEAVGIELIDPLKDAKVDNKKALELAYEAVKDDIASHFDGSKYLGEVQVKLINSRREDSSPYYYYIAFVLNNDELSSCLIDPMTGKILGKKTK